MRRIVGLDLGPNSIGSASIIFRDDDTQNIEFANPRSIPMDAATLKNFEQGVSNSAIAKGADYKGTRRLIARFKLRRDRSNVVLNIMGFLPTHYSNSLTPHGKFKDDCECKLAWRKEDDGEMHFIFEDSFNEMLEDFKKFQPDLVKDGRKIPYDWTIYYLRKKALYKKISKYELAWILLKANQKRGYNKDIIISEDRKAKSKEEENKWKEAMQATENDIDSSSKYVGEYIYNALLANPSQKIIGGLVCHIGRRYYEDELDAILTKQEEYHPELRDRELYGKCITELYKSNEAHRNHIAKYDFKYLFIKDIIYYQRPLKSKKSLVKSCNYEKHQYVDKETGTVKNVNIKCIAKSNPYFQEFRLWQFIHNLKITKWHKTDTELLENKEEVCLTEEDKTNLFEKWNDSEEIKLNDVRKYLKKKYNSGNDYEYCWNYAEDRKILGNKTRFLLLKGFKDAGMPKFELDKATEYKLWHILYSVTNAKELKTALEHFAESNDYPKMFAETFFNLQPQLEKGYGAYSEKAIKKLLSLMRTDKYWNVESIDKQTKERIEKIITGEYDEKIRNRVREMAKHLTDINDFKGLPLWLTCYIIYNRHSEIGEMEKWENPNDIDRWIEYFKQHYSLHNPIVENVVLETMRTVRDIWKQYGKIDEFHIELGRDLKNSADKRKKISARNAENERTNLRIRAMLAEFARPKSGIKEVKPYSPYQQELLKIYEEGALATLSDEDEQFDFIKKVSRTEQPSRTDIERYKLWLEQRYVSPYTGKPIPLSRLFTNDYEIEHIIPKSRFFDDSLSNKVICENEVNKKKDAKLGYEFIKYCDEKGIKSVRLNHDRGYVPILSLKEYEKHVKETYKNNKAKLEKLLMEEIPKDFIKRQLNDNRYISKFVMYLLSNIVREEGEYGVVSKNVIPCNGRITSRLKKDWGLNDVWNRLMLPRFQRMNDLTGTKCFTTQNTNGHKIPDMPLELRKGFNIKRIDHRHHAMDAIVIACTTREHVNLLSNEAALSGGDERNKLIRKLCHYKKDKKRDKKERVFTKPWDTFTTDVENVLKNIAVSFKQRMRILQKRKNKSKDDFGEKTASWIIRKKLHEDTVYGEINLRKENTVKLEEILSNPKLVIKEKDLRKKVHDLKILGYDAEWMKRYFKENKDIWSDINVDKIVVSYLSKDRIDSKTNTPKERFFASRYGNDVVNIFSNVNSLEKAISIIEHQISDKGIQTILKNHLESKGGDVKAAFSSEGVEEMNSNIKLLNNGKEHKPIYKIRTYKSSSDLFPIGTKGNKNKKFAKAAKYTNLFFAIYEGLNEKTGVIERIFETIPLREVIRCKMEGVSPVPMEKDGKQLKFYLTPNDLVYLPTSEEIRNGHINIPIDMKRVYKMVDTSQDRANFVPYSVASTIYNKEKAIIFYNGKPPVQDEFGVGSPKSKNEKDITNEIMIKKICVPLKIDRLGNIIELNGQKPSV